MAAAVQHNVVAGVLTGLVAAVVAAAVWFGVVAITQRQIGLIALAVGWVVGQAVVLGGRGRGGKLQGVAVGLTLLSMAVAEYLVTWQFHNAYFSAEGLGTASLVLPVTDVVAVIGESLTADPLTLMFWLLALAMAWRVAGVPKPKKEN